jgi:two-component system NarL family response regulator
MDVLPEATETVSCVLLADRHYDLTEAVRGLLETMFDSVVMVADEASLLDSAGRLRPEMAIVDLSLAHDRSLGWLRALRQRCPELTVIVLSVHDEPSVRRLAKEAGADGFVLKHSIVTDLLPSIEDARRRGRDAKAGGGETPTAPPGG